MKNPYKKNICFIIILMFIMSTLGCQKIDVKSIDLRNVINEPIDLSNEFNSLDKSILNDFNVDEFVLNGSSKNLTIGDQTLYGNKIYYIAENVINMSNYSNNIEIYEYDILSKNAKLIYTYVSEQEGLKVNELKTNGKYIFWNLNTSKNKSYLCKLNLEDNKVKIIRNLSDEGSIIPACLSIADKYLSWYELIEKDNTSIAKLFVYNIENDKIKEINNDVYLNSPYDRAHIRDNKITFLIKNKDYKKVCIYNLENNEKSFLSLPKERNIVNIFSNNIFTVWHENYGKTNIYLYDHKLNKLFLITSEDNEEEVFSMDFNGQHIFINNIEDNTNNIICIDIKDNEKTNLTQHLNFNRNYLILTEVTVDGRFIARNIQEQDIEKCIIINSNIN